MSDPIVSVIKTGIVLQGKGASAGATVLLCKPVEKEPHCTIVFCHAPASPNHPYVVWTYNEISGTCHTGDYFDNPDDALKRYVKRTW